MVCRVIILLELSEVPLFVPLARSVRIQLAMRVCCSVVCWRCRPQLGIAFRQIGAYYTCVSFCNGLRIELELELELIRTNPNDTEANAAGRSVCTCVARKSKS